MCRQAGHVSWCKPVNHVFVKSLANTPTKQGKWNHCNCLQAVPYDTYPGGLTLWESQQYVLQGMLTEHAPTCSDDDVVLDRSVFDECVIPPWCFEPLHADQQPSVVLPIHPGLKDGRFCPKVAADRSSILGACGCFRYTRLTVKQVRRIVVLRHRSEQRYQ